MTKKRLIDLTDARFSIPANEAVLDFVQRTNPSAHSDVGAILFALAKEMEGVQSYCPLASSFAYVALHTSSSRIFAIAFGMRGLAFRLATPLHESALSDGALAALDIGAEWVSLDPWDVRHAPATREWLRSWADQAFAQAVAADAAA